MKKVSQGIKSTLLKTTILRTLLWGLLVGFGFVSTSEAFAQGLPTISVSVPQSMPAGGYEKGEIVPLTIAVTAQNNTVLSDYISTGAGTPGMPSEFFLKIVDQTLPNEVDRLIRLRYVQLDPNVATSVLQQATETTPDLNTGVIQVIWNTLQNGTLNYIVAGDLANTVAVSVINIRPEDVALAPTTNASFSTVVPTFTRKNFVENTEVLDAVTDSPLISIRPVNAIYERGYWTAETIDFTLSINDNIVIKEGEFFDVVVDGTSQGAYRFENKELYKIINMVSEKVADNKVTLTMANARQIVSLQNTNNSTAYVTSAQTYTLNFLSRANRPQLYMGPAARGTGLGTNFNNCSAFNVIAAGLIRAETDIYLLSGEYSTAAAMTPNGFLVNQGICIYGGYQGNETDMQVAPSKRKMRTPSDKQIGLFGVGPVNETTFNFANNFTGNLPGLELSGANYIDGINIMNATTAFTSRNDQNTISNCKVYDCREMVSATSDLTINNSVFYANGQALNGQNPQIQTITSHATFNNCIFGANRSQNANFINGNVTFNHCIITRNDNASPNLFISGGSNVFFRNSVLFNQHGGASFTAGHIGVTCENFYTDQMANAPAGAIHFTSTDAMSAFVNPDLNAWGIGETTDQLAKNAAFDFRLTRTSILTNAGASTPVTYDITGQPRSGSASDVGCYETQLPNIANAQRLYVGANALSSTEDIRNCDGSTWEKALPNFLLDDVFQRKSVKEIFLTGGDFVLNTPQTLERALSIYGGFNGGETTVDSRSNPILRISGLGYYTQNTVLRMPSTQTNGMFKITGNDVVFNGIGFSRAGGATTTENGGYINLDNTEPNVFKNCYFDHLSTTGNGGGIYSSANTTALTFENCAFDTLQAENGGAVYSLSSGDLSFNQCRFNSNSATENGGAIYAEQANNVIIKNSHTQNAQEIVNNKATLNGGFLYTNSDVTTVTLDTILAYGKIEGNAIPVHANKGGLVFVNATTTALSLNNASINHLQVDAHTSDAQTPVTTPSTGGVIASLSTETLTLNNCTFSSNSALGTDGSGGVVSHAGVITATKMGEINGNHASVASVFSTTGAISIDGATKINDNKGTLFHALGSFNIKNVQEIKDNKNIADTEGTSLVDQTTSGTINLENIDLYSGNGTISSRTQNQNAVTITNSKFDNNNLGANYLVSGATDVKTNSMICTNNISTAGLLNATASISVDSKTLFENNSIGASLLHAPTITAKNSRFIKNSTTGNIGIIESTTSVTLDSCRFFSNTANSNAIANVGGTFNATHCIFSNNHSAQASNISTMGKATIDNSLFAFNTGVEGAILTSTVAADVTNCTIAKNNDLSTATVASNTLDIPTTIGQVKNTIFWGNRGGVAATLQLPKELSSYCAIEGDVNNRSALTDDTNTIIIKETRTNARGPRFQQYNLIDKSAGANLTYTVADLDELLFNIDPSSPCINRGNGEIPNMTDLMGNTRTMSKVVDIGAHESSHNGIAFVKMVPDTGFYGVVGGHSSRIVLSEPENFPSPSFDEVDKFKVAHSTEFKKVFYESEESIGLKQYLTPNTQERWRYFPTTLNYEILSAKLTLDIQCKMGSTPFNPGDEVTMNELLTFNVLTNREKADVKCEYAGTTYTVGTGLTPPPFTRALQSQSNIFTFTASGKNYEPISKTITITATTEEEGYVVVVNGISQGLKKQGDSLSLTLEGAPAGRAIWSCTNGAIVVPELDRISNPFHFTMPKKRVVLEAHGRDFYVGTNALGTGDGRSQLNRAATTNLPMILDSASALSIIDHTGVRSENFVFVDSGTYKGTQDSHVAFTIPTYTKMVGTKDVVFENNQNTYLFELTPHAGLFNIKIDGLNWDTTTGVYTQTENATSSIDSVLIVGCKGDAVYAMGKSIIKISKSNIQANQVALHVKDAVIDATNCLIAHNTAEALKVESNSSYAKTKGTLLHCTIVNNSPTPLSSKNQYSVIEVNNSILWHATNDITLPAENAILTGCAIKATNSLAKNILITTQKTVDFVTPPSTVDTAKWANYNWNLKPTSVCINRAEPTKTGLLSFDIQDSPRYAYAVPDIGAYEVDTKGHSYATFEKDHVVYNASEVKLALKDDASYPGKDDFVSFTPSIIDSGIYQNVTPTGMNWTYAQATVTVDSAPLTSFTINNNSSEDNTTPLSELNINCTATGINKMMVQGLFELLTVDGNPIVDSKIILPQVDSVFGYSFTPFKNYAPNIGTFQVDCQWQALAYEVIYNTHTIVYGNELIAAVDTAYGVIKDGNGNITDTIYGDYAFQDKMIAPIGTRNYFLDFKPHYGQNQKPTIAAVEVTIEPLTIADANVVDSIIVTDTMYVYGQSVEPKVYLHATLEGKDSVLLRTTDYTISFSTDKNFTTTTTTTTPPIKVDSYYIKIVSTQQCNYNFTRLDSCVITQKPLIVDVEGTRTSFGTKPMPTSVMTGLAYTDQIPYTLETNWKKDSAVGTYANEFVFTPSVSTDNYLVTITGDTSLIITPRLYLEEEISIKEPESLIYDGNPKIVTITRLNLDSIVLTQNDYTISYVGSTTMPGTVNYTVVFKNNFEGNYSGEYTITLEMASINLTDLKQKYDGTKKQATVAPVGTFSEIYINYLKEGQVVADYTGVIEPGIYTVQVTATQSGSSTPIVIEKPFEVYTTPNMVYFDEITQNITEGDSVILLAHLVDTPSEQTSVSFILNATIDNTLYQLSAKEFTFAKNVRTDSIVLTSISDKLSNPAANIKLTLFSSSVTVDDEKSSCSITINDDGNKSSDPEVVVSELKFIENQLTMSSSTPLATLRLLSGASADVTLKFSSMSTGDLTCNGIPYDGGKGVTLGMLEGVNPITVAFASEKLKTLKNIITVSVSKISSSDLHLTKVAADKTCKITYVNDAPILMTDDVSVMFENDVQDKVYFDVLQNDKPYFDALLPSGELFITALSAPKINNIKLSVENQKLIKADFTDCTNEDLIKGFTVQFSYTVNQVGAGAAEGIVNMTVALKQVKGAEIEIKGQNITKKTPVIATYEDPFKKPSKTGTRTRSFKMKRTSDTSALLSTTIVGFNKSALAKAYANGYFFADMFNEEDSTYMYTSHNPIEKTLIQVTSIGSHMNDKPAKGQVAQDFGSWNISPSENIQLGTLDSVVLTYSSKGVIVDSIAFSETLRASNGKTYAIISGDYFGSTPTAYLEYLADNGKIKKISLSVCKSVSVKSITSGKTLKWSSKNANFGNVGKGSKIILLWPTKASLDKLKHAYTTHGRIDLIINNASFQTPVKNFQNNSQNIVK